MHFNTMYTAIPKCSDSYIKYYLCNLCLPFDFARYICLCIISENTRHFPNVALMLARRLRRRPNIKTTLEKCLVFAGNIGDDSHRGVSSGRGISHVWCQVKK